MKSSNVIKELQDHERNLDRLCRIEDGFIVLGDEINYAIKLSRCASYEKIVWWVSHLSEKTWMTLDLLARFIETACEHHGLQAHGQT